MYQTSSYGAIIYLSQPEHQAILPSYLPTTQQSPTTHLPPTPTTTASEDEEEEDEYMTGGLGGNQVIGKSFIRASVVCGAGRDHQSTPNPDSSICSEAQGSHVLALHLSGETFMAMPALKCLTEVRAYLD